ncbi:MAG TPA: hypothetical protein VHF50_01465 [Solirubrobacterales bacterium]|nr:hypothetical protein [Solirubrobacterales bacterium]
MSRPLTLPRPEPLLPERALLAAFFAVPLELFFAFAFVRPLALPDAAFFEVDFFDRVPALGFFDAFALPDVCFFAAIASCLLVVFQDRYRDCGVTISFPPGGSRELGAAATAAPL